MGTSISNCDSNAISNMECRSFFEQVFPVVQTIPDKYRKQNRTLIKVIYDSLKKIPANEKNFGVIITGKDTGPLFISHYLNHISFPETLTKLSLRKCNLKSSHAKQVSEMIVNAVKLEQLDAGENNFGDKIVMILNVVIDHPSLKSLILDGSKIGENATDAIINLLKNTRKLETLRLEPAKINSNSLNILEESLKGNYYLKELSINQEVSEFVKYTNDRNIFISDIIDSIARAPFQREFRAKIDSFKSVKGREMIMGRALQKKKIRNTKIFDEMEEADKRAKIFENQETNYSSNLFRSGQAEMIGRRPNMEDVSIILNDVPAKGAYFYGLFDGHGGREAAEFAANNLPKAISDRLIATANYEDAYIASYRQLQMDMKPWCVYVGTTSVIAVIEGKTLTVANVGDSRCVICRDGVAERLSVDHKPDLPEETAYIQSKGGFVREGRVGGMLAVSRALGDGFLGDAVNSTPSIKRIELKETDSFLILACDGVWDVLSDQESCDIVASEIDPLTAAKKLRDRAFELNSLDNISVIVVFLSEVFANEDKIK